MKYLCITYLILINMVCLVDFIISHRQFYPNLPMGEYRIINKFLLKCNNVTKSNIMFNLRVNKKSASSSEILGNITLKVPFDDSFSVNINWAVKDLIGGWKDNAHVVNFAKACTGMITVMNKIWPKFANAFGLNMNCPLSAGTYVSKGFDLSGMTSNTTGIPSFFYGSYKIRSFFIDKNNNQHG